MAFQDEEEDRQRHHCHHKQVDDELAESSSSRHDQNKKKTRKKKKKRAVDQQEDGKKKHQQQRSRRHDESDDDAGHDKDKSIVSNYDPDGRTMNVARGGMSHYSAAGSSNNKSVVLRREEKRHELEAEVAKLSNSSGSNNNNSRSLIQNLIHGSSDQIQERQTLLAADDAKNAALLMDAEHQQQQQHRGANAAMTRNDALNAKQIHALRKRSSSSRRKNKDKALASKLETQHLKRLEAAINTTKTITIQQTQQPGYLEIEHDMERTTAITQQQLRTQLAADDDSDNAGTQRHIYDLELREYGPYGTTYDRSGRYGLLYGQKGHVAIMDCHYLSQQTEFHVNERVRDGCFLHNKSLFALAQQNHCYIYDDQGTEIHRLDKHQDVMAMQYLPYHWLLATIGRPGVLHYQDVSTGQLVSSHRSKLGPCSLLKQNPTNAILHAGHSNGTVTLWSPANSKYLVKLLCHKGSTVSAMAIDPTGHYMVTGGIDRQVKVWDLRMYKQLHAYYTIQGTVPTAIDISQRGILGIGHGAHATFWPSTALPEKAKAPYMHHLMPGKGPVQTLQFRPYEDVCAIGHQHGISSVVIPGSGEPNIDTTELYNMNNPMADRKQRREGEVRALLEKLQPEMITLDSHNTIGGIEESDPHSRFERLHDLEEHANEAASRRPIKKQKGKKRGRSKIQTQLRRKHRNVVDQNTVKLREAREQEKAATAVVAAAAVKKKGNNATQDTSAAMTLHDHDDTTPAALKRFF